MCPTNSSTNSCFHPTPRLLRLLQEPHYLTSPELLFCRSTISAVVTHLTSRSPPTFSTLRATLNDMGPGRLLPRLLDTARQYGCLYTSEEGRVWQAGGGESFIAGVEAWMGILVAEGVVERARRGDLDWEWAPDVVATWQADKEVLDVWVDEYIWRPRRTAALHRLARGFDVDNITPWQAELLRELRALDPEHFRPLASPPRPYSRGTENRIQHHNQGGEGMVSDRAQRIAARRAEHMFRHLVRAQKNYFGVDDLARDVARWEVSEEGVRMRDMQRGNGGL